MTVNENISVLIPEGMLYSTDKSEIKKNCLLVFMKEQTDALYKSYFGEANLSLADPSRAAEGFTLMEPGKLWDEWPLPGGDIMDSAEEVAFCTMAIFEGDIKIASKKDNLIVYYVDQKEANYPFLIFSPNNIYFGNIWANDARNPVKVIEKRLSQIKLKSVNEEEKATSSSAANASPDAETTAEEKAQEAEAKKYGVSIADLPKHRLYLNAKTALENPKDNWDFQNAIQRMQELGNYLDSAEIVRREKEKKQIEENKKRKKRLRKNYIEPLLMLGLAILSLIYPFFFSLATVPVLYISLSVGLNVDGNGIPESITASASFLYLIGFILAEAFEFIPILVIPIICAFAMLVDLIVRIEIAPGEKNNRQPPGRQ